MSEFSVAYDRDEGSLRIKTDLETSLILTPVLQDAADLIRDSSKAGVGLLQGLVELQRSVLEAQK